MKNANIIKCMQYILLRKKHQVALCIWDSDTRGKLIASATRHTFSHYIILTSRSYRCHVKKMPRQNTCTYMQ